MRSADASSMAIGFSQSTWTPAAAASSTTSSWVGCGVQTDTRSRPRASSSPTAADGRRNTPGGSGGTGPFRVDVAHPHDLHVVQGAECLQVVTGNGAASRDSNAEGAGGCGC